MNLQKYQDKICNMSSYPSDTDASEVNAIGVAAETGEVLGEVKRMLEGRGLDLDAYLCELGDVLAYTTLFAGNNSIQLEDLFILPYASIQHNHPPTITKCTKALCHCADELLSLQDRFGKSYDYFANVSALLYAIGMCAAAVNSDLKEVAEMNYIKLLRKFC